PFHKGDSALERLWAALFRVCGRLRDDSALRYRCAARRCPNSGHLTWIQLIEAVRLLLNALGVRATVEVFSRSQPYPPERGSLPHVELRPSGPTRTRLTWIQLTDA